MPTNSFAVPHVQVTSLDRKLPDPMQSLGTLMRLQMAQARMAQAAANRANANLGKALEIMVPTKDGKKAVTVYGHTPTDRKLAAEKAYAEAVQKVIAEDTALQKDLTDFESLSIPGRKEVLDRVRTEHAPRLAQTLGMSGEDLTKQLTAGLDRSIREREKAINDAGIGTQLYYGGKQIYRNTADAIGAIGESSAEILARGKASAEAAARDARENAFQDEINRLQAEGRSTLGFQLRNFGKSAAMHGTGLAAMVAPPIAAGALGTAVGGPVAGAAAAIGVGALSAGLPSAGEAIQRVAEDPNLKDAQKEATIGQTAALSGGIAGAIGAIPGPAGAITRGMANRAVSKKVAPTVAETAAKRMMPSATQAERAAAEKAFLDAQRAAWTPNLRQQVMAHGLSAGAQGGAFQIGSNAAYGLGTGQPIEWFEGVPEAIGSGMALGLPFGVGGRIRSWRQGMRPGLNPSAQPNWDNVRGARPLFTPTREETGTYEAPQTVYATRGGEWPAGTPAPDAWTLNAPAIWQPTGGVPAVRPETQIPTRRIVRPQGPIPQPAGRIDPALPAAPTRAERTALPQGRGDIVMGTRADAHRTRQAYAMQRAQRDQNVAEALRAQRIARAEQIVAEREERRVAELQEAARQENARIEAQRQADEVRREEVRNTQAELRGSLFNGSTENLVTGTDQSITSGLTAGERVKRGFRPLLDSSGKPEVADARAFLDGNPDKRATVKYMQDAIASGRLSRADVQDLRDAYYDLSKSSGKQRKSVKGLIEVVGDVNREAISNSRAGRQTPSVESARPDRAGRTDNANTPVDSELSASTSAASATPADEPVTPAVASRGAVEGRGNDGAAAQDTRPAETPTAAPVEPRAGGPESPVREPGAGPAAVENAEGGAGERVAEPATEQRARNAGDAGQVDAGNVAVDESRNAEIIREEAAKPESEPPSVEYTTLKDKELLESYGPAETPVTDSQGIYAKALDALNQQVDEKIKSIWGDKTPTATDKITLRAAFIKAAMGENLTPREKRLYDKAVKAGVQPLEINKTAVEQTIAQGEAQGYNTTAVEAVTDNPATSQDKVNNAPKGCTP